jgi:allantoinase
VTLPLPELGDAFVIRSRRVVTPDGVREASVHIEGRRITRVATFDEPTADPVLDAEFAMVMPGVIDTHVHVNDPGRAEWEGFETATRAAAAGGVTTLLDMPLNSIPPTTTVEALEAKREAAHGKTAMNVEFIGGVVPGNVRDIEPLARAGVRAFKCFLTPSGVDEFPAVTARDLRAAFPALARTGLPLMVHAEDPAKLGDAPAGGSRSYATYLASRPPEAEQSAIELVISLMRECPTPVHTVHLSSVASLPLIREARASGLPLTVETCPHYLTFAAEDIPDGATELKCAPPIRGAAERFGLWTALWNGDIDLVASDHSPCPPQMKATSGDFFAAWGGIASLQLSLAAVSTGAKLRGIAPEHIARWMSAAPAKLAGLSATKGALAPGFDADVTIWSPESVLIVDPARLHHRHSVTPYAGRALYGVVRATIVGGRVVFSDQTLPLERGA